VAGAGRPDKGDALPGRNPEGGVLQQPGFGIGIAEEKITNVNGSVFHFSTGRFKIGGFRFFEHDIRESLDLEREHAEVIKTVDKSGDAGLELLLIGDESKEHADGELPAQHQDRSKPDDSDGLQSENKAVRGLNEQ